MHILLSDIKQYPFDELCNSFRGKTDSYVLLDGSMPGARAIILACYEKDIELAPLTSPADSKQESILALPFLIRFDMGGFVREQCRNLLGKNSFVFVQGDEDLLETAFLLAKMLWVGLPPQGKLAWFRFYSPSVLAAFLTKSSAPQLERAFAGSLKGYWIEHFPGRASDAGQKEYSDPVTEMSFFPSPFKEPVPAQKEWMRFQPVDLDWFEDCRDMHFTVGLCRHVAQQRVLGEKQWPQMRQQLEQARDTAAEYGISSFPCLCLYVDVALRLGWDFALTQDTLKEIIPRPGIPDAFKEDVLRGALKQ